MTAVVAVRRLETCVDSSWVDEVELQMPMDETWMTHVAEGSGELDYHPEFARPYFRITKRQTYVIQGVLGNKTCRVTFWPSATEEQARALLELVEYCAALDNPAARDGGRRDGTV